MNQKELSLAQHRDPKPREGTVAVLEFPLASLESILTGYPLGSTTNLIRLLSLTGYPEDKAPGARIRKNPHPTLHWR